LTFDENPPCGTLDLVSFGVFAAEQKGNNLANLKDFGKNAKASIWS